MDKELAYAFVLAAIGPSPSLGQYYNFVRDLIGDDDVDEVDYITFYAYREYLLWIERRGRKARMEDNKKLR